MKQLYIIFALITFFQCCTAKTDESALQRYIFDFMATRTTEDINTAMSLIPTVTLESERNEIDPLLTAFIISQESSWRVSAVGGIGEVGLMQVVPNGVCAKGHNLETPSGQIAAGTRCLAMARDSCDGSLKQMLTMYASGKCVSKSKRTQRKINWRILRYKRLQLRYE
jgi:soluble lytic murein transglycosylase-like protein